METQEAEKTNGKTHVEPERPRLKLALDYKMPATVTQSPSETTSNYIDGAVSSAHPQGVEGQMRRIYGRLQRKIDKAIEEGFNEVELEAAERDLLRKSFNDCKISAALSKYFVILEDEIERVCKS